MIIRMKAAYEDCIFSCIRKSLPRTLRTRLTLQLMTLVVVGLLLASCASAPQYPASPPPITKTLPVGFDEAFQGARMVLNEDSRVFLHTVDKAGRLIAYERTSGFIFFQHRTILDLKLESVSADQTRITMQMRAEDYEMGGLTRSAGWYPSAEVDIFLGEDIMNLIEKRAAE